jgi:chondroitin 4-sulfotransferase 11
MIDHDRRVIFIHQRKVAGMSIMAAFGFHVENPDFHRFNDGALSAEWRGRDERERSYFVFSAVRNPFDRLISGWKYLEAARERPLLDVLLHPPGEGHDYRHFTRPQIAILRDQSTGALIVDDLVRFENLQADFARICDRLGTPHRRLPHINASKRQLGYRDYFDERTRRMAEEMFAADLAAFGYDF